MGVAISWLDLHMHSNISNDGDYSPEELMALCNHAGMKVVALADHNSVKGWPKSLILSLSHCGENLNKWDPAPRFEEPDPQKKIRISELERVLSTG